MVQCPSKETLEALRGIANEIGAGMSLHADGDSRIWNLAHRRALAIIDSYKAGVGLFQDRPQAEPKEGESGEKRST